jgi:Putative restriction endonuclease
VRGLRRGVNLPVLPSCREVIGNLYTLMAEHVYVERTRLGIITERAIEGAPTLVVEVLSPSTDARDRGVKQAYGASSSRTT